MIYRLFVPGINLQPFSKHFLITLVKGFTKFPCVILHLLPVKVSPSSYWIVIIESLPVFSISVLTIVAGIASFP